MTESCSSCRFWKRNGCPEDDCGKCRCKSPMTATSDWPHTAEDEWCGEYERDGQEAADEYLRKLDLERHAADREISRTHRG